jgi:ankyrin repeat protein
MADKKHGVLINNEVKSETTLLEFWDLIKQGYHNPSSYCTYEEYCSILQHVVETLNVRRDEFKDFVNKTTEEGNTALILACEYGQQNKIITILIDWGSDIHHKNNEGCDALLTAAKRGYVSICEILLKNGANPNTTDKMNHESPLFMAAWHGHLKLCLLLIECGANLYQGVAVGNVLDFYAWKDYSGLDEDEIEDHRKQLIDAFKMRS